MTILDEIRSSKEVVLFIGELHTLLGAGAVEGAIDAANMPKPALARGEIQCIGATTLNECRKYIEKDAALHRRRQVRLDDSPGERFPTASASAAAIALAQDPNNRT